MEDWRKNCHNCPFFDKCESSKSAKECEEFLNRKTLVVYRNYLAKQKVI